MNNDQIISKVVILCDVIDSYLYELEANKTFKYEVNKVIKQGKNLRKFLSPVIDENMQLILGNESDELKNKIDKLF